MLRSAYFAQEVLTTFTEEIGGITLKPSETSGTFLISVNEKLIFDRKTEGRFPEIKELKQLVRNLACPDKNLGHSERK